MTLAMLPFCTVAALVVAAWAGSSPEVNFLRSGLVLEGDVKHLLSDELTALGENSRGKAHEHLGELRKAFGTMYASLPKNAEGMLSHQVVRYALHRYFVHRHGWFIRGLEPGKEDAATPDKRGFLSKEEWVPSFLQELLERRLGQNGTDLGQVAVLAAALEGLISQEGKGRLKAAYMMYQYPLNKLLTLGEADELLLTYYVAMLNSGDFAASDRKMAQDNTKDFISDYSGWAQAYQWLEDIKKKDLAPRGVDGKYDFESLARVVDKMGEEYYTLNDLDCDDLKDTLVKMQGNKPGRVRLSAFYSKGMYSHWDFSERRDYLSSLGALDETDPQHPYVIIANYAMARPNCLDSSNLFTICCRNECEDKLSQLEAAIGSATAKPSRIVELISTMRLSTVDSQRTLSSELLGRLNDIAARHSGSVPLHGRLFAQWMHHAYPLECPYPHEMGTTSPLTQGEWIKEMGYESEKLSVDEIMEHIASDSCAVNSDGSTKCAGETAELPWSDNEELLTGRLHAGAGPAGVPASTVQDVFSPVMAFLACILAAGGLMLAVRKRSSQVAWRPLGSVVLLALAAWAVGLLDGTLLVFVLGVGFVVIVANDMTSRPESANSWDSKQCV